MPLPQIKVLDVNQPVQNYLSGQFRGRQEARQDKLDTYTQEDRLRSQGREDEKFGIQKEAAALKEALAADKWSQEQSETFLDSIDPESPEFEEHVSKFFDSTISRAQQMGFSEQSISMLAEQAMNSGAFTRESIRRHREQSTKGVETYSPSPLKKLIDERQSLVDSGVKQDDVRVQAYDNKITGVDIDIENLSQEEVDMWGNYVNLTGKMPSLGRGKQSTKIRVAIVKSAARQALGADEAGVPHTEDQTPAEAALDVVVSQADTKAIGGSLNFLEKQIGSMGSFVTNLGLQVDKVKELSKDLETYDTRLLNIPLRTLRGKILGSPLQAKYDMYLAEIESEIGKLATGSSASVAELSATAQDRWAKIHDKNLSVKDMLLLLDETKNAAKMRMDSVNKQLSSTRKRLKTRDYSATGNQTEPGLSPEAQSYLKSIGR